MNRYAIFTVIVGGYDKVKQPLVIDDRFDYILFSDTPQEKFIGVWQVRAINYNTGSDFIKARYPRTQPEKVLPEYDAWLYIDGTLQITSQYVYDRCIELFEQKVEFAANKHHCRNNVYEEITAIILDEGKEPHDYDCITWYWYMKSQGYPEESHIKANFYESGIIYRMHTKSVERMNNLWWDSLIHRGAQRDQFSLPYALWKVPSIKEDFFLPNEENVWHNSGYIKYTPHTKKRIIKPYHITEKIRYKCWRRSRQSELYTSVFDNAYNISRKYPYFALECYTLYLFLRYGIFILPKMIANRVSRIYKNS